MKKNKKTTENIGSWKNPYVYFTFFICLKFYFLNWSTFIPDSSPRTSVKQIFQIRLQSVC